MRNFSILINTTDSFEDCWNPFFILFKKYWPTYTGIIYLNTETKDFTFPNLNIVCIKNKMHLWSDCMLVALDRLDNDYILYLQEDYFLKDYVKTDLLNIFFERMVAQKIDCLHLTDQNSIGPYKESDIKDFIEIAQNAKDRISCQAAIWKKNVLRSYLRKGENGWQFETYGTIRSHFVKHNFFAVNHDIVRLNEFEIIPYIFTGIVKGKWYHEVNTLFATNNIIIDYTLRGFYYPNNSISFKKRLIDKITRQPKFWLTTFDILMIILKRKNNN
jgi:hypothetical protein